MLHNAELIAKMSIDEKISLVSGEGYWHTRSIPRLDLPSIHLTDGPHGVRKLEDTSMSADFAGIVPTTAFPTASLLAASFDPDLAFEEGRALGEECRKLGVDVLLGPGVNIKRSPLCGRNFEYFSEDPLLSSAMGAAWIKGLQSTGTGASLKHFAVNNQERRRMTLDAVVDPRALREIYLAGFEGAVKEGRPATIMAAYNKLNGDYCCESGFLLEKILRGEWGFEGLVVSDWGATDDRPRGLLAGCDLEMPDGGRGRARQLRSELESGRLAEKTLDRAVDRVVDLALRLSRKEEAPFFSVSGSDDFAARHHELARRVALESMILLKNEEDILPLSKSLPIGVVGELARSSRYQGAGSSTINPTRLESLLDAMEEAAIPFEFEAGYRMTEAVRDPAMEAAAIALARRVGDSGGFLIYFVGLPPIFESEGFDRETLDLPANQLALFERLEEACPRLVVVWSGGSPVATDWLHHARAFLAAYLGGQAAGAAIRDLLFGEACPSGRLAESWPLRLEDTPAFGNFSGPEDRVLYKEGIFIGYRWYSSSGRPVRFPFGFGLSYTNFVYRDPRVDRRTINAGQSLRLSFEVANVGRREGREVAQVYLSFPESGIERPAISLADFRKVGLGPGESARLEFDIGPHELRYWDVEENRFLVESGPVILRIGPSSAVLPLEATVHVENGSTPRANSPRLALDGHPSAMSESDFALRYRGILPLARAAGPFTLASTLGDMAGDSALIRLIRKIIVSAQTKGSGTKKGEVNYRMLEEMVGEMPVGRFEAMSGDRVGPRFLKALVEIGNHRLFRALFRLLGIPAKPSRRP